MATRSKQPQSANQMAPIVAKRKFEPRWFVFPDEFPNGQFRGYENRQDPTKVRGAFVAGQNIKFRDSDQPTLRDGFDTIGTAAVDVTPVVRAWIFETRSGNKFEVKSYNGSLYYWLLGVSSEYGLLKSGFTVNAEFGYANIGESGGEFHSFFCNGVDPWYEWNGAYATVLSTTANTITMSESGTFTSRGFYSSGTRSVVVNGVTATYTGGEGTATLTGVSSTVGMSAGDIIVQAPRAPTWRILLPFRIASTGTFKVAETVTGGTSGVTATVQRVSADNTFIVITAPSGSFATGETITGGTSGATAPLAGSLDQTSGPPLASIVAAHLSRIHVWSAVKQSVWQYSVLDDPYCWTVFGLDTSGGKKDIEFGGPGTAFGRINQTILGYKNRSITTLEFVQSDQRLDVPRYDSLIQVDDKGTSLGAINQRSTFTTPYGMVSVTPDDKMILIEAISSNDQPNYTIISDPIQPVFTMGVHDDACGICVDGVIWYAYKQDTDSGANDTVITGDLRRKTVDAYGNPIPLRWDLPTVGWQVKDWTAAPDDIDRTVVHFHSSLSSNSYAQNLSAKVDNGGSFTALLRTWSEFFGPPQIRKRADRGFIEILLRENSVVNGTLLLDEEGFTAQIAKTMRGTDTANRFGSAVFNPFGASVFGGQKIGSNGEIDDRYRYRFYFELKETLWFFNMALSLEADTENSDFELIRWGIHVVDYEVYTPKALSI